MTIKRASKFFLFTTGLMMVAGIALADGNVFTFTLPTEFTSTTLANAAAILSQPQIAGLVAAIIGIGIGLIILEVLVAIFRKH